MPSLLRTLERALLTAGLLGVSSAALAGNHLPPTLPNATRAASSQVRSDAMKVEIALLADQGTYALKVEAKAAGDVIVLSGDVADLASCEKALAVARAACYTPVQDHLTVAGRPHRAEPRESALHGRVRETLVRKLGAPASGVEITTREDGVVTLRGTVPSMDDKAQASRCLRQVEGVTSVTNQLVADGKAAPVETVSFTPPVDDPLPLPAQRVEPRPAAKPAPVRTRVVEYVEPVETVEPSPAVTTGVVPSGLPRIEYANVYVDAGRETARPVMYVAPATGYATSPQPIPVGATLTPVAAAPAPEAKRSFFNRLFGRAPVVTQPAPAAAPRVVYAPQAAPAPQVAETPRPTTEADYRSRPLSSVVSRKPISPNYPAAPVTPAAYAARPAPAGGGLAQAVQAKCGNLIRQVRVESAADGHTVHVHAPAASENQVIDRLMTMPEIAAKGVTLRVHFE